jgi:hypothetical protein
MKKVKIGVQILHGEIEIPMRSSAFNHRRNKTQNNTE